MVKECYHCKIYKNLNEFHKSKDHEFGVGSWCKECKKESDKNNPNKYVYDLKKKARTILSHAISFGNVIKPTSCTYCSNSEGRINGHHVDYNKPLKVIWLCDECHYKVHH